MAAASGKRHERDEERRPRRGSTKVRDGQYHFGMRLIETPHIAIGNFVTFFRSRVFAFNLNRPDELNTRRGSLGGNEVHAFIAMWEVYIPTCISHKPSHVKLSEVISSLCHSN